MLPISEPQDAWEQACQRLVQSLGFQTNTNTLEEAQRLAQALGHHGERANLYIHHIEHRFGAWGNAGPT